MAHRNFSSFLRNEPEAVAKFTHINPPFNLNASDVAKYSPEVTGHYLLKSLCRRLGWPSLTGRRLLDFGCGVRFAQTIINLGIDIGLYAGVDTNEPMISWLQANVDDPRFRFQHLSMRNAFYNPGGAEIISNDVLDRLGLTGFDAACMFSVITHQSPDNAARIFSILRRCVHTNGALYFTAFTDAAVDTYVERDPTTTCLLSTYNPDTLIEITEKSGWFVRDIFPVSTFQQTAFVCHIASPR